jgi:hypothetical protein
MKYINNSLLLISLLYDLNLEINSKKDSLYINNFYYYPDIKLKTYDLNNNLNILPIGIYKIFYYNNKGKNYEFYAD